MTQEDPAIKLQLLGLNMTALTLSRIENNLRHVCDTELIAIARILNVSMVGWSRRIRNKSGSPGQAGAYWSEEQNAIGILFLRPLFVLDQR